MANLPAGPEWYRRGVDVDPPLRRKHLVDFRDELSLD
jgi:hypothetical protein